MCMACVQPVGVCLYAQWHVSESCIPCPKAVSYEHKRLHVLACSCICRGMCLVCQGKWQVCMSRGCAEVEKGRNVDSNRAQVTCVPTFQLHEHEDLSETRYNFSEGMKQVPSPVFSVERNWILLEI